FLPLEENHPKYAALESYVNYLERNYFGEKAKYSPVKWNVFGKVQRTNNRHEGFNRKWNSWNAGAHSSLKQLENSIDLMLRHVEVEETMGDIDWGRENKTHSVKLNEAYMLVCAQIREEMRTKADELDPMDMLRLVCDVFRPN